MRRGRGAPAFVVGLVRGWEMGFARQPEAALRRPLAERIELSFIWTPKPVIYDVPYRSFDTMEEYRAWCRAPLPSWLGYW